MRFGAQEVAQAKDLFSVLELDIGDEQGETEGTELVAGDGKVVEGAAIVIAVLDDPFNDFPGKCERHGKLSTSSSRDLEVE